MKLQPINRNIVVEPILRKKSKFGIEYVEKYMPKARQGKVLAVSDKCKYGIQVGDTIRMKPYEYKEIELESKLYYIVHEDEILGIIK